MRMERDQFVSVANSVINMYVKAGGVYYARSTK